MRWAGAQGSTAVRAMTRMARAVTRRDVVRRMAPGEAARRPEVTRSQMAMQRPQRIRAAGWIEDLSPSGSSEAAIPLKAIQAEEAGLTEDPVPQGLIGQNGQQGQGHEDSRQKGLDGQGQGP